MNYEKKNYHDKMIPVIGGILILFISLPVWFFWGRYSINRQDYIYRLLFLSLLVALTGLIDDLAGRDDIKGLKGHFKTLLISRRWTTGIIKILFFLLIIFFVLYQPNINISGLMIDLLIVLLFSNFFNLLDLRPGRALKFFYFFFSYFIIFCTFLLYINFTAYLN